MLNFKSISDLLAVFPNEQSIIKYLEKQKWGDKVISPYDPNSKVYFCPSNNQYKCKNTGKFFNVKTGTAFANTKLPLRKWFLTAYLFTSHKKGISSCQLAKYLNITQKSAWHLLDDLRDNIKQANFIKEMLKDFVEIDETFVGGKNKNRHWDKKIPQCQGRSWKDKVPVLGMIERNGRLIAQVVQNTQQNTIEPIIRESIKRGSNIYTDEWLAYKDLYKWFNHSIVNHRIKQYVNGEASTNSIEGFWSHLKRGIYGTYHWISRKHTQKYIDEFALRFNTRKRNEQEKFDLVLSALVGKSLSYRGLFF
ncbi:MAG: IS1595 family transposase ISNwi1 [Mycoplasmataceae bacterium]|nr:MAG: IS1595 family transposase ISNwi1 [Mycoplasmataceae bacterium]